MIEFLVLCRIPPLLVPILLPPLAEGGGFGVGHHLDIISDLRRLVEVEIVDGQGHLGLDEGRAATT